MKLNFKRLMAMLLCILMIVGMMPMSVFATSVQDWFYEQMMSGNITLDGSIDLTPYPVGIWYADGGYQGYDTLEAAITAAKNGDRIVVEEEITLAEPVTIPSGLSVTLDLYGNKVNAEFDESTSKHIYPLDVYGTLTIKDAKGNGSITGRGIFVRAGSKLTIDSGSIYAIDSNGGSALFMYGGDVVINGGHIEQKASGTYNFAIQAPAGSTVTVNGGWVGGNHGAIAATGGQVVINDGTLVCTGTAGMTDNVVYSSSDGSITINGGEFIADNDVSSGGACVYDANGGVTINGGTFGSSSGGDVWGTTGTTIKGGTFENLTETSHIADGYEISENGEIVKKATPVVVAEVNGVGYATLEEAVDAAQAGDTIVIISNISDEAITADKSLTITGNATLTNVSINGTAGTLTVSNLTFEGNSWINAGGCDELVVKNVTANVDPSNGSYTNSRSAFIGLGRNEAKQLKLTVTDCEIIVPGGTDAVLGWAAVTEVTISDNTFGSETAYQNNGDIVKFMAIANGAVLNITNNTSYSDYNGFVFAQNTTRDNAYTVYASGNTFYGGADHIWIEISGGNTVNAKIEATSDNTVNGNAFTAADIKYHSGAIKNWNGYAGVDVTKDSEGKLTGGSFLLAPSEDTLADGYEAKQNADGTYGVAEAAPAYVAEVKGVKYMTLTEAFAAVTSDGDTVTILDDVTENLTGAYLRGNIVGNATITLTNTDWVYCPYTFVIEEGITLNVPALFYYAGGTIIRGKVVAGAYYQCYKGTKLTIAAPGSMTVTGETFILRYVDGDPNAGIYVDGGTLNAPVIYFYQGMINAKDATIVCGTYWQTNETDGQGTANLVLDNSTLTVSVYDHPAKATGNSTVTLKNGSTMDCKNGGFTYGDQAAISIDSTSLIIGKNSEAVKPHVAKIGKKGYTTLQAAINAVQNGQTITLVADVTENVTLTEKTGLYYTIDGNGKTMKGTITISSLSDTENNRRITIKNINFVNTADAKVDFISSVATNHYPRLTVEGCTFTGNGNDGDVAIRLKSSHSVVIKDCTGSGLHSFLQNTSGWNLTVENVTVTDSKGGLALGTVQGVTVKGCNITVDGYGIRMDAQYNNNAVIESNTVEAFIPVVVRKASVDSTVTFTVTNIMTATNTDGIWMAIGTTEYEENSQLPTAATGKVTVTLNDTGLNKKGVYGSDNLTPKGGSIIGYTSADGIWGEVWGNASESFVIKVLDANGNVMGTTSLNNIGGILDGDVNVTWNLKLDAASNTDEYWTMSWTTAPTADNMPATVELWVDGVKVSGGNVLLNGPDDLNKIYAATADNEGKITKYYTSLNEALAAAKDGDEVEILVAGTYALSTSGKNITITGAVDGVVFDNIGAHNMGGADVTFNNVTFDYYPNVNYTGLQHSGNLVYNNCIINGQVFLYGTSETFNNCEFNQNSADAYNVWTYGAKEVAFNECTFNSAGKSVLIYSEHASVFNDVTVTGCTFKASAKVEGKAAIEMDSSLTAGIKLTIDAATTATGFGTGNVSGNSLWNNKKGNNTDANNDITVVVGDTTVLAPVTFVAKIGNDKYATLEEAFKAATNGCTIEILADVTIDGKWDCRDYATNGSHSQFKEFVTINGNGHTIKFTGTVSDGNWNTIFRFEENATVKNLTVDISEATGAQRVISAKKSLTVDGLTIIGSAKYGVIFGEGASAADLAATEIVIKNSTLTGTRRAISDNEGGKDVKSVTITGNTLNANACVSASNSIIFNNNVANGEVDLRSYTAENVLSVEAKGNTLTAGVKNYIFAKNIDAQAEFTTKRPAFKVATKAELTAALAAAADGDTIILTADIDYGTTQLAITKAITLDLGGHTLTTSNAYGGMSVKNNPTIKNGTIVHASNTAAIKVWNATAFEDLVIDVQGKGDANKTIGGIVLQSGSTTHVGYIKNVTIKGEALTNGIETYNCGDATENVIGSMENVTIKAQKTGMLISAPCGTATNCDISGDVNAIEIWIKGNYSASLTLANSTVEGGVFAHDEVNNNPDVVNNGNLNLTVDAATQIDNVTVTLARAEKDQLGGVVLNVVENAQAKVNGTYYATVQAAIAAAKAGDTVKVFAGTYAMPAMKAGITIEGEGEVLFEGTLTGTLENLTLKNIHIKGGNAQRWAYAKGNLVFENVTFEATGVYALHFDGITAGATLLYKDCTIIGWAAMSGSPASCVFDGCTFEGNGTYGVIRTYFDATIKNCTFDVANVNTTDIYQDGIHAVSGAVVTVNGCTNANGDMKDIVNIEANSVVVLDGEIIKNVAKIGDNYYATFNDAYKAAKKTGDTIKLLDTVVLNDSIGMWINYSTKKITVDATDVDVAFDVQTDRSIVWFSMTINAKDTAILVNSGNVDFYGGTYNATTVIEVNSGRVNIQGGYYSGAIDAEKSGVSVQGGSFTVDPTDYLVGGYAVSKNADNTYGVVEAVAKIGNTYYATLEAAIKAAENGDTVTLLADVELPASTTIAKSITIDGNGKTITQVAGVATDNHALLYFDAANVLDITIKNATFSGIHGTVIRTLGANTTIENCVFENCTHTGNQGLVRLTQGKGVVNNSKFLNNTSTMIISYNYDTAGLAGDTFELTGCEFTGNTATSTALVYYVKGEGCTMTGNIFENNIVNCNSNGATVYMGFTEGNIITGNIFKNNKVVDSSSSTRVGGAIFLGYETELTGNVFVGNTASNANGDALGQVCTSTYYDCKIDLSGNYWGGAAPVYGKDYTVQHQTGDADFVLDNYYTSYTTDADGNVVVDGMVELTYAAMVGKFGYATLAEAFAAANDGDTIKLLANIAVNEGITNTKKVTLNLNGKTITGTDNSTASFGLITNKGELTIIGNGTIILKATNNRGWNAYSSVISNTVGGKLIVENGTIEHLGGTDMAYGIDNLTNGKGTYAETVINGGTVKSPYRAIRQFLNGVEADNILTVNGGTIEGTNKSIWMQDPSKNANTGKLTVGANAEINGDIYLFVTAGSTEWPVEVAIAAAALADGSSVVTGNVPLGYYVENVGGTYGVEKVTLNGSGTVEDPYKISTLKELIFFRDSVNAGETKYNAPGVYVALGADIDMADIDWSVNIGDDCNATFDGIFDGKGHTIENLTSTETAQKADGYICTGLFGAIYGSAQIKNLTIENVNINAEFKGNNVGAVVGFVYEGNGAVIENVKVIGNININAPKAYAAGAIVGYAYYGNSLTIKNCSVEGTTGSAITANSASSGIIGYSSSYGLTVERCTVKGVALNATAIAGGLAGVVTGGTFTNNTVENVTLTVNGENWKNSAAVAVGTLASTSVIVSGTVYSNVNVTDIVGSQYAEQPTTPVAKVQAKIGDTYYATFASAYAAAKAGETITLLAPIVVANGETLTLDKDVTIEYTSNVAGEDMITVRGTLVIDGATVVYNNTDTAGRNVTVSTISCEPGSVLEVKSGTVKNDSANNSNAGTGSFAYAIDLLTNGNLGDVTATISGGKVISTNYMAIRQFVNGEVCKNILNVTGGEITGATRGINIQLKNNLAYTTISDGTIKGGNYSICFITTSEHIRVSGGEFIGSVYYGGENGIISGGTYDEEVYAGYIADGFVLVKNSNGTYGVEKAVATVDGVGYATLDDAIEAAKNSNDKTVVLQKDYEEYMVIVRGGVTLDLNGYTLTAYYVNAFKGNHIVDKSATKNGLLVVDKDSFALAESNAQMPVYSTVDGGYKFFGVNLQADIQSGSITNDGFTVVYRPSIGKDYNSLYFGDGAVDNEIEMVIRLTWDYANGETTAKRSQDFVISDGTILSAYSLGKTVNLVIFGLSDEEGNCAFENMDVCVIVKSTASTVEMSKIIYTYNKN